MTTIDLMATGAGHDFSLFLNGKIDARMRKNGCFIGYVIPQMLLIDTTLGLSVRALGVTVPSALAWSVRVIPVAIGGSHLIWPRTNRQLHNNLAKGCQVISALALAVLFGKGERWEGGVALLLMGLRTATPRMVADLAGGSAWIAALGTRLYKEGLLTVAPDLALATLALTLGAKLEGLIDYDPQLPPNSPVTPPPLAPLFIDPYGPEVPPWATRVYTDLSLRTARFQGGDASA